MSFFAFDRRPGFRTEVRSGSHCLLVSYDLNRSKNYQLLHAAMAGVDPRFRKVHESLYEVRCSIDAESLFTILSSYIDADDELRVIDPKTIAGTRQPATLNRLYR